MPLTTSNPSCLTVISLSQETKTNIGIPLFGPSKCFLVFFCLSLLLGSCQVNAQNRCYTAPLNNQSQCTVCFDPNSKLFSCGISNRTVYSQSFCRENCCTLSYNATIPSTCINEDDDSSNSSLTLGTVLVIVFFAIPLVICIIALIHSCVTRRNRRASLARPRRERTEEPARSTVNLQDFNMDEQFPYIIDISDSCSICLEDNCNIVTFCGHLYHSRCFAAWIHKKHKCPLCVSTQFNPLTVYCSKCYKAVKMTLLFKSMTSEETGAWIEGCNDMCENCKQPEDDGLSFGMDEEAIKKY